jgi:HEAT repeat protein
MYRPTVAARALLEEVRYPEAVNGDAVAALCARLGPDDLPWVDEAVRAAWRAWGVHTLDPAFPALRSVHPDGFVREEAVRQLARSEDGSEVPWLLLRVNDWVAQVRDAAREAVSARVRDEYAAHFARNFLLVDRLAIARRGDHAPLMEAIRELLATPFARPAVLDPMRKGSRQTGRAIFRFLLERVPADGFRSALDAGLGSDDAVVRAWAARAIPRIVPAGEARPILRRLTADSSPLVRRETLDAILHSFPDEGPHVEPLLLDRSASVRERARFLLRDRGIDYEDLYRRAIDTAATPRHLAIAIGALAEVGTPGDAAIVASHLSNAGANVRRAAVKGVIRLGGEGFAVRVAGMLEDPSPAVSGAARRALRPHAAAVGMERLWSIFESSPAQHVRLNALHVMSTLPKWQRILCFVRAAKIADQAVASMARHYAGEWNRHYNRGHAVPSARELGELTAAVAASRAALGERIATEIEFTIRSFA